MQRGGGRIVSACGDAFTLGVASATRKTGYPGNTIEQRRTPGLRSDPRDRDRAERHEH